MKKDLTRYAMTILLACSLLLSGCGSIPIPGIGPSDSLPTDSRQSGEETEPEQEGQNEDLSRNGSMNKEQENTEEKADTGSTDQTGAVTSENDTADSTAAAGSKESSSSAEVGAVRKESFDWLKGYVPVSTEPITVRRWNVTTSESFKKCCEIFEEYTGIHVNLVHYEWNDYQKMLDESFEYGVDPGIVRIHPYFAARYIDQGDLIDLNDLLSQHSLYLKPENVNRESLSTFTRGDKLYGIISNMSCSALWYNKKLFDEKQLPYPDKTWTWEDVAEAAAVLNDPENERYGISLSYKELEEGYYNIIAAYNGSVINEDRTRSGFDQEGTLKAMELTADLIRRGMPPVEVMEQNDQMSLLCSGKTAMAILGSWRVRDLEENEFALENLDCTILPYAEEEMTRGGIRTISGYSIARGCDRAEDYWHFIELMYCYDRIAGSDTGFAIPIDPSAVKTVDAREYPFALRESYLDLLYTDLEYADAAAETESVTDGQAPKTRILDIPCSRDTDSWVSEIGKYMKKAWYDPDKMEEYCRELAWAINLKLDIENH